MTELREKKGGIHYILYIRREGDIAGLAGIVGAAGFVGVVGIAGIIHRKKKKFFFFCPHTTLTLPAQESILSGVLFTEFNKSTRKVQLSGTDSSA